MNPYGTLLPIGINYRIIGKHGGLNIYQCITFDNINTINDYGRCPYCGSDIIASGVKICCSLFIHKRYLCGTIAASNGERIISLSEMTPTCYSTSHVLNNAEDII